MPQNSPTRVAIIGGGLAGLAAGCALADAGFHVELFERRPYLGGRASSYQHPGTGEIVDNCQHVLLGCCTNLIDLYRRTGGEELIRWYDRLTFIEPGGRRSQIAASSWPAPFHSSPTFLRAHALSLADKLAIGRAMLAMMPARPSENGQSFKQWLKFHGQTDQAIRRFWEPVLVSALNEDADRLSVAMAGMVFRDAFLKSAEAGRMGLPTVPLTDLYSRAGKYIEDRGGRVHLRATVEGVEPGPDFIRVHTRGANQEAHGDLSGSDEDREGHGFSRADNAKIEGALAPEAGIEQAFNQSAKRTEDLSAPRQWRDHDTSEPGVRTSGRQTDQVEQAFTPTLQAHKEEGPSAPDDAFDYVILAVPVFNVAKLLPDTPDFDPIRDAAAQFEPSPITGVHLWFDREITELEHAVLLDRTIQWMFHKSRILSRYRTPTDATTSAQPNEVSSRATEGPPAFSPAGETGVEGSMDLNSGPGSYVELVISSSKSLLEKPRQEIIDLAVRELTDFFPIVRDAKLLKATVIKEVHATFSPRPGIEQFRPAPTTANPRLLLAGDWVATGWPATMEGAVRSGYMAAEALLASTHDARKILVADLPARGLMRLFR